MSAIHMETMSRSRNAPPEPNILREENGRLCSASLAVGSGGSSTRGKFDPSGSVERHREIGWRCDSEGSDKPAPPLRVSTRSMSVSRHRRVMKNFYVSCLLQSDGELILEVGRRPT